MKVVGIISLGLTVAASLAAAAAPQKINLPPGIPHGTIVSGNIFGLVPIPKQTPPPIPTEDSPPKITANGIMNVFGSWEALFKVSFPARGKDPARDQSYMLVQGQRQDGIAIRKIDAVNSSVSFEYHGTVHEIPLVASGTDSGSTGGRCPRSGPQVVFREIVI